MVQLEGQLKTLNSEARKFYSNLGNLGKGTDLMEDEKKSETKHTGDRGQGDKHAGEPRKK
jgi:hypothetical protein